MLLHSLVSAIMSVYQPVYDTYISYIIDCVMCVLLLLRNGGWAYESGHKQAILLAGRLAYWLCWHTAVVFIYYKYIVNYIQHIVQANSTVIDFSTRLYRILAHPFVAIQYDKNVNGTLHY